MYRFIASLFLLLAFTNCKPKAQKESTELTKVTVATGGCYGRCPFEAIELNSDGSVWYYGGLFSKREGTYQGTISNEQWTELVDRLKSINYMQLDDEYSRTMDDIRMEIVFSHGKNAKRVNAQSASLPDGVMNVFLQILALKDTSALEETTEQHRFETTIQKRNDEE